MAWTMVVMRLGEQRAFRRMCQLLRVCRALLA
ncbi:hypothetical protein SAMN04489713_12175 [Actinomadura madurae]|uniref:Uncharacterized protein n=1 Tax=Actinomadura madurae TaxID=1993 RepID=A0A1I5VCA1_9ACTN|nr:hypothetical protein SAMN04489713_12175 [Actinomadura madurae]